MGYIIESLLDMDFYKFTMGQLIFHKYKDVPVTYTLTNRTKGVHLADYIDEKDIRREFDHVMGLSFGNSDLHYLRGTNEYGERMFKEDYLEFLRAFRLPSYHIEKRGNDYHVEFKGAWAEVEYWETVALSIINELYNRALLKKESRFGQDVVYAQGRIKLDEKLKILRSYPYITFSDFGTRRRFSRAWQEYTVRTLAEELPPTQFKGTSNTFLARQHNLMPIGTSAHSTFMGMSGIMHGSDQEIRASHNKTFQDWWDEYGWGLSIALIDTYGSHVVLDDMSSFGAWIAKEWKGLRQDSGDPSDFARKAIAFYNKHGVDPREKMIVFSDSLTVPAMCNLWSLFHDYIRVTFGWGTNLTNDLVYRPLSLVIKLVEANGFGTVKLSDNLAKAVGRPEDIECFKRIFGYTENFYEECRT